MYASVGLESLDIKVPYKVLTYLAHLVLASAHGQDICVQREDAVQGLDLTCCCWATFTSVQYDDRSLPTQDFPEKMLQSRPAYKVPLQEYASDFAAGQTYLEIRR